MTQNAQQWEFMGYDVRQLGKRWRAAWHDFLWGDESPLRSHFDDVVAVKFAPNDTRGTCYFQAGQPTSATAAEFTAQVLPAELVLARCLQLPLAVSADLEAVLALEVAAYSPFPADDTVYGWRVIERTAQVLVVQLAIVSKVSVMSWVNEQRGAGIDEQEIWAEVDGEMLVISGLGYQRRQHFYRRRLLRTGGLMVWCVVALIGLAGIYAASQYFKLSYVSEQNERIKMDAQQAGDWRTELVSNNEAIAAANELIRSHPSPHSELARLTALLGDDLWLLQFNINGSKIRLQGRGKNAADAMQRLTDHNAYEDVSAPQAITKLGTTGLERFMLDMSVRGDSP